MKSLKIMGTLFMALVLAIAAGSAYGQDKEKISIADKPGVGSYLTNSAGKALYTYKKDTPNTSACWDTCLEHFPVYCWKSNQIQVGKGLKLSNFKSFKRTGTDTDDHLTYKGMPLYEHNGDTEPGDTKGHGVDGLWSVARP